MYDRWSQTFAPSKFCAYAATRPVGAEGARDSDAAAGEMVTSIPTAPMTLALYTALDERVPAFDGAKAREHLERRLGLQRTPVADLPAPVREAFARWGEAHREVVGIHPAGLQILQIPDWYA